MQNRRRAPAQVTPEYEDEGIFKGPLARVAVNVTPKATRNTRGDMVVDGFVSKGIAVEVVFAGRRKPIAEPLMNVLKRRWTHANKLAEKTGVYPKTEQVQFPIQVVGTWRPRFESDNSGWLTKSYQLLVAQWTMVDAKGEPVTFGEPPLHRKLETPDPKTVSNAPQR